MTIFILRKVIMSGYIVEEIYINKLKFIKKNIQIINFKIPSDLDKL